MVANPNGLADYWDEIHTALHGRLSSVKKFLRHPSSGANAEEDFRQLLRDYLPKRFAVESGFVVNTAGERSAFIDVLLVDAMNIAPLSAERTFKVFPSEAVVGAIEITSAPKSRVTRSGIRNPISKMLDDVLKLARLREIAREREYFVSVPDPWSSPGGFGEGKIDYSLAPRCFLITFGDEWARPETYILNLLAALIAGKEHSGSVWINGALSLRHGLYHFEPHTNFTCRRIETNPLLEFMMFVNQSISSVPTGGINMRRYRPTIPRE